MTTKLVSYPIINHNGEWRVKFPGLNKPIWEAVGRVDFDHIELENGTSYYNITSFNSHNPPRKCWFREAQGKTEGAEPVEHSSCKGCKTQNHKDMEGFLLSCLDDDLKKAPPECRTCFAWKNPFEIRTNYTPTPPASDAIPKPTPEQYADPESSPCPYCKWQRDCTHFGYPDEEDNCCRSQDIADRAAKQPEPPAPDDTNKGVFQGWADQCSDLAYWMEVNGQRDAGYVLRNIAASLVDGKKFGPESDHAAECEGLIKRLVAWPQNDYREFDAIMTEARRLYPEAK